MSDATEERAREEWDRFLPDLVESIEQGLLDQHLRAVARALFARRDAIKGTQTVMPEEGHPDVAFSEPQVKIGVKGSKGRLRAKTRAVKARPQTNARVPVTLPHWVRPTMQPFDAQLMFRYEGRNYLRSDVIGATIRIPADAFKGGESTYNGMLVKITGVGPRAVKVLLQEDNERASERTRKAFANGDPVFMPHSILHNILATP